MEAKIHDTRTGEEFPVSRINDLDSFDYKSAGFPNLTGYILTQLDGLREGFRRGYLRFGEAPEE